MYVTSNSWIIFIQIYDVGENMSYEELPLHRGSSSNINVFRLFTINIYVTCNSCTNFCKNTFDRKKVIHFFQLDLRFDPLCIDPISAMRKARRVCSLALSTAPTSTPGTGATSSVPSAIEAIPFIWTQASNRSNHPFISSDFAFGSNAPTCAK